MGTSPFWMFELDAEVALIWPAWKSFLKYSIPGERLPGPPPAPPDVE
jgi:hypothetical protein